MPNNTWFDATGTLDWNSSTGWSLNRVPANGDSIFITGPHSPNNAAPPAVLTLASLDTTGLTDTDGFDINGSVGPMLSITSGGYLLLANTIGTDSWYGNASLAATATFLAASSNAGVVGDFATFKNSSTNSGTVGNHAIFQGSAVNQAGSTLGDNCIFQDNSENDGNVGDNTTFENHSLAYTGNYGRTTSSITRFVDSASWFNGQVAAGTVYWNSTGTIGNGIWTFAGRAGGSGSSHTVGGGILGGV